MKSLLLTFLLLGLVAVLKAQEVPSDDQVVSGIWYTKANMHNDSLPGDKMLMKAFPMKATALEGGNLETKITFWRKGHCHDFKILMKKTEEAGKYIACNGRKTVYIEELPVKDHYIFYCEGQRHGKHFSIGKLVGRDPKENPEAMAEFKKFTQRKGLREENIFVPEMSGLPGPCFRSWLWEGLSCRLVLTLPGTNKHQAIFTSAYRGPLLATLGFAARVLGRPSHLLTSLNFLNSFTQE
ncbi:odorant-binding protein 2a-like [Peromyscus californicus insignis]|uniref:odorant-binding protein 2a-like n=1 Tax=Peromyscus californicus insignis TaxID=564181 RepID=UPI0022A7839E|nr:odorant-binding protein 2a-like [Peromyscus californicus insignis]